MFNEKCTSVHVDAIADRLRLLVDNLHDAIDQGTFSVKENENSVVAVLQQRCDEYADLVRQQDEMISQLQRDLTVAGDRNLSTESLTQQLRAEKQSRLHAEEQSARILFEQQRTIQRLEAKLPVAESRGRSPTSLGPTPELGEGLLTTQAELAAYIEELRSTDAFEGVRRLRRETDPHCESEAVLLRQRKEKEHVKQQTRFTLQCDEEVSRLRSHFSSPYEARLTKLKSIMQEDLTQAKKEIEWQNQSDIKKENERARRHMQSIKARYDKEEREFCQRAEAEVKALTDQHNHRMNTLKYSLQMQAELEACHGKPLSITSVPPKV